MRSFILNALSSAEAPIFNVPRALQFFPLPSLRAFFSQVLRLWEASAEERVLNACEIFVLTQTFLSKFVRRTTRAVVLCSDFVTYAFGINLACITGGFVLLTDKQGVHFSSITGQLSSCKIEKETAEKLSQLSSFRSKMLNLRECVNELKDEKHFLAEQLNALKMEHAEVVSKFHTFALEIRKNFEEQWERERQKQREEFDKVLKAAEESQSKNIEETEKLKKELEEAKGALLCQICFERRSDCIILPCSHLLYCRECVTKHKKGDSRCPTCRGPINSEILCNVNHPS